MDLRLSSKTAIVAAASKGLGKAVAAALAAEGANVVMFSRNATAIEAAASQVGASAAGTVLGLAADATNPDHVQSVVDQTISRFGTVHVLYNNAGGPKPGMFDSLDDDAWQHAFELNLMSAVRLTRLCLPHMRRQKWGRVITGTSITVKQPISNLMLSNSIRSATTAWSKSLADQVAADGITVNCLAPGRVATDRLKQIDADTAERTGRALEDVERQMLADIPVGRYGEPAEFGAAAAFLASEPAAYITGVTLLVDGGLFRGTY